MQDFVNSRVIHTSVHTGHRHRSRHHSCRYKWPSHLTTFHSSPNSQSLFTGSEEEGKGVGFRGKTFRELQFLVINPSFHAPEIISSTGSHQQIRKQKQYPGRELRSTNQTETEALISQNKFLIWLQNQKTMLCNSDCLTTFSNEDIQPMQMHPNRMSSYYLVLGLQPAHNGGRQVQSIGLL